MKKWFLAASLILMSVSARAAVTPCEEIKSKVETRLAGKGIKHYSLQVVAKATETKNRIVGTCDGGKHKIIYHRAGARRDVKPDLAE